jgi:hypothetical protein
MSKKRPKKFDVEPGKSAGFLLTLSRAELDELKSNVPEGMSLSEWSRKVLLNHVADLAARLKQQMESPRQ